MDSKALKRLEVAVTKSMAAMDIYRRKRLERLRERIGTHYSDEGTDQRRPVNLLAMAGSIYLRQLAGGYPKVLVNTHNAMLFPAADDLEQAGNMLLKKIDFITSLRHWIVEAFYGAGVMKVGLNKSGTVEIGGFTHDVGQPFADVVSLDNFVLDTNARKWEEITFAGDFYRMELRDVAESGLFQNAGGLKPEEKTYLNNFGGDETAQTLGGFQETSQEEFTDKVTLLDLWLPGEQVLLTVAPHQNWRVLREVDWEGPKHGPYHLLYLDEIPDNLMPMPPSATWLDLHRLANSLMNKLGDQADRQKSNLVVPRGGEGDAEAIKNSADGDVLELDQPDKAQEVRYGGPDQINMAFFIQVKDLFSWMAGNLDTMGGLSRMADTLGQEQMLDANSFRVIEDMRDRVIQATQRVVEDLLWYLWTDPLIELPIVKRVPGTDVEIPSIFSAENREGDFLDYNFEIDPYSLRPRTPGGQLQKIRSIVGEFIMPLLPVMQSMGISFKFDQLFELLAEYADVPELARLIEYIDPAMQANHEQEIVASPVKPPVTTRNYNRLSSSTGGTRTGRDQAMMQSLLGSGGKLLSANPDQ